MTTMLTKRAQRAISIATASTLVGARFVAMGLALAAINTGYAGAQANSGIGPKAGSPITFKMVVSGGASKCLPNATATVKVIPTGPVEFMDVTVKNLPPNTGFDVFILQDPLAPFGVAWYQGDIDTDDDGEGRQRYVGRFNIETFAVAQGAIPAPVVHNPPQSLVSDANFNPIFEPIHTFHVGIWFNSPADAAKAGCPATETRFNGEHNAGIQVLHTTPLANGLGPLSQLN